MTTVALWHPKVLVDGEIIALCITVCPSLAVIGTGHFYSVWGLLLLAQLGCTTNLEASLQPLQCGLVECFQWKEGARNIEHGLGCVTFAW